MKKVISKDPRAPSNISHCAFWQPCRLKLKKAQASSMPAPTSRGALAVAVTWRTGAGVLYQPSKHLQVGASSCLHKAFVAPVSVAIPLG